MAQTLGLARRRRREKPRLAEGENIVLGGFRKGLLFFGAFLLRYRPTEAASNWIVPKLNTKAQAIAKPRHVILPPVATPPIYQSEGSASARQDPKIARHHKLQHLSEYR